MLTHVGHLDLTCSVAHYGIKNYVEEISLTPG